MRARHPERLRGFDYVGYHRYFLTFCTFHRHPLFVDDDHVDIALAPILRACGQEQFATLAYCFMPDHLHLLVESLSEVGDGRRLIARAKQFSGHAFAQRPAGAVAITTST